MESRACPRFLIFWGLIAKVPIFLSLGGSGDLIVPFLINGAGDNPSPLFGCGDCVKSPTITGNCAIVPDLFRDGSLGLPAAKVFYFESAKELPLPLPSSPSPKSIVFELFRLLLLEPPNDDLYFFSERLNAPTYYCDGLFLSSKKSDITSSFSSESWSDSSIKLSLSYAWNLETFLSFIVFLPKRDTFLKLASNLSSSLLSNSFSTEGACLTSFLRLLEANRSLYPS